MQSHVDYLLGIYGEILSQISQDFPRLRRDCDRDSSRLLSLVKSRGLSFFMIDLPDIGKVFDRALSDGHLPRSGLPCQRPFRKGSTIPRLFKGLYLLVFDEFGVLRPVPDRQAIRYLRQLLYVAKKMKIACDDSRTWEHVREFFETDRKVRSPSLDWDCDELNVQRSGDLHFGDPCRADVGPLFGDSRVGYTDCEGPVASCFATFDAAQRAADIVAATIGRFDPSEWRPKHGPGAVADQRHTQFKYDFPNWPAKLANAFCPSTFGFANDGEWAAFASGSAYHGLFSDHEPPSKLIAVPKTLKGPRLIASEPVAHQWCQQMIMDFLTTRLSASPISSSIRFRDQSENQRFAKMASLTQSHVTVDLKSASDRLSCWVVERMFRRNPSLLLALHAARTRWISNEIDKKSPQYHLLRKFSCQGSACTFPVQSYVFCVLAVASVLHARRLPVSIINMRMVSREVRVFGDDIIIPVDGWDVLRGLLGDLGLKVNPTKTYESGNFRESCGTDAYGGDDVTPIYASTIPCVSRPESIVSCVEVHNNFASAGYWGVCRFIRSTVNRIRGLSTILLKPFGSGAFGWTDFENVGNKESKTRWNPHLQRLEIYGWRLVTRSRRFLPEVGSVLLQYFTVSRSPPRFLEGERLGVVQRPSTSLRRGWVPIDSLV